MWSRPWSWLNRMKITSLILIKLIHSIIQNRIIQALWPYRFFLIRTRSTIYTSLINTISLIHTVLPNLILRVKSTVSTYLVNLISLIHTILPIFIMRIMPTVLTDLIHPISLMKTIWPNILQRIILAQSFRDCIIVPLLRRLFLIVILQKILIMLR